MAERKEQSMDFCLKKKKTCILENTVQWRIVGNWF